jgi:hypothetical protein
VQETDDQDSEGLVAPGSSSAATGQETGEKGATPPTTASIAPSKSLPAKASETVLDLRERSDNPDLLLVIAQLLKLLETSSDRAEAERESFRQEALDWRGQFHKADTARQVQATLAKAAAGFGKVQAWLLTFGMLMLGAFLARVLEESPLRRFDWTLLLLGGLLSLSALRDWSGQKKKSSEPGDPNQE